MPYCTTEHLIRSSYGKAGSNIHNDEMDIDAKVEGLRNDISTLQASVIKMKLDNEADMEEMVEKFNDLIDLVGTLQGAMECIVRKYTNKAIAEQDDINDTKILLLRKIETLDDRFEKLSSARERCYSCHCCNS